MFALSVFVMMAPVEALAKDAQKPQSETKGQADDKPKPEIKGESPAKPDAKTKAKEDDKPAKSAGNPTLARIKTALDTVPDVLTKPYPDSAEELQAIQKRVKQVTDIALKTTVGIIVRNTESRTSATGSGVIISEDGYVLTAGHVAARPNQKITVILPDGKRVSGKTLGINHGIDSGLIKLDDDKRKWPFAQVGSVDDVGVGHWCVATGHPGGWRSGRPAVVRVGRLIQIFPQVLRTDCTLVGGDSGGPLFDMRGRVIGIHSRISVSTTYNMHVPIDTYRSTWDRLAKAETWGGRPYFGIKADDHEKGAEITEVVNNGPAKKAKLQKGDVITKYNTTAIKNFRQLVNLVRRGSPGDKVQIEYLRDGKVRKARVTLGNSRG